MKKEFKTDIVKTREFSKIFLLVFAILYLISIGYVFFYDKENQNIYLKYVALAIYVSGIYVLFEKSLSKPKKIGQLIITTEAIEFSEKDDNKRIPPNELDTIYLRYLNYGSWTTHSIY